MSPRDKVLFLLPAAAVALVALFTVLFFTGLAMFKQAFHHDADSDITEKTALVALILNPLLDRGASSGSTARSKPIPPNKPGCSATI